jgi:hypothetical protein
MMGNELVLALVCVLTFYGAGGLEARDGSRDHGVLWALLSALISAAVLIALKGSWGQLLLAQVSLFLGIGAFRMLRNRAD